jgi:hypothetical protein
MVSALGRATGSPPFNMGRVAERAGRMGVPSSSLRSQSSASQTSSAGKMVSRLDGMIVAINAI